MKAVAAVAEILKREGVKFLIGYPVNSIIEAAASISGVVGTGASKVVGSAALTGLS